ncbi:MAG: DegV family protein [Dehalococcoidales bacterium]|nr:DegV family protein [Dehalococcoidales bacterium]
MPKVAIVTDSLACLTKELAEQYNITIVPLSFLLQGKVYRDWVDITPTRAYELFLKDPDSFETSAPSPEDFLGAFRKARNTAPDIFCTTVSVKLSTTINAAKVAAEQIISEIPGTRISLLDSRTSTAATGMIALTAARASADGKDFSEVINTAEEIRGRVNIVALLDTIRHVYRSGRIPKVASQIGSFLKVKPVLSINQQSGGLVHFNGIERSHQNGIQRIIRIMKDDVGSNPVRVAVMHAYAPDEAEKLKDIIKSEFECRELWVTEFSPLMGYAIGTGAVGMAYHKDS